jgi:hypothetical protein
MRPTLKIGNHAGFSLIEVIVYAGITASIGLIVARYMTLPTRTTLQMVTVSGEQSGYTSTAIPVADLKSGISSSIQWNLIDPTQSPPYNPSVNSQYIPWFQVSDPSIPPPALPISYVCYTYRTSDQTLLREFIHASSPTVSSMSQCAPVPADKAQETIIARNMLRPTTQSPLFAKDPAASNMIVLTLLFPGPAYSNTPEVIVRRVHMRS